jgi:hypothetical protein
VKKIKYLNKILAVTFLISQPLFASDLTNQVKIQDKNCLQRHVKYTIPSNLRFDFYIVPVKIPANFSKYPPSTHEFLARSPGLIPVAAKSTFLAQAAIKPPAATCKGVYNPRYAQDSVREEFECINSKTGQSYRPVDTPGRRIAVESRMSGDTEYRDGNEINCYIIQDSNGDDNCINWGDLNRVDNPFSEKVPFNPEKIIEKDGNWHGNVVYYSAFYWRKIKNQHYYFISRLIRSGFVCELPPADPRF